MWGTFLICFSLINLSWADLVIDLPNGKVQGSTIDTPSGKTFYAWKKIPFAEPPLGSLRYLPPVPAKKWEGILDCTEDAPSCVVFGGFSDDPVPVNGESEDCLYLNVYSPIFEDSFKNYSEPLSVMVWIYGGAYHAGSADFNYCDPTAFLDENVIVVTLNYRLGTLGFLSTEDGVILGNAGLKDQLLAIQWTKDNIANFGGDPEKITIFGESAGAVSVGHHILSPRSRGLFRGAIMESGSSLMDLIQRDARTNAYSLAKQIDSSISEASTSEEVLSLLQEATVEQLTTLTESLGITMGPVVEIESDESFLTEPFYERLSSGNIAKVPVIIGFNSEEAISFVADMDTTVNQASFYDSYPEYLIPNIPYKQGVTAQEVGNEIHKAYVGENGLFSQNLAAYFEFYSDNFMNRNVYKYALLQSKVSPVYMYQFSYYGTLSKSNIDIPGAGHVGHAQEVGYLFNISNSHIQTESDYLTRRRFVKLWTNFAKTLNPTPDDSSSELLQNVEWRPITEEEVHFLDIDDDLKIMPSRKVRLAQFWDYLWDTYSYHPYHTF